ncbi:hypothetical protein [Microbulbifer taiwanensis]|uniref:hypothetical protein n=1 Tax=Microbulbifer taiwanensis TaxID=986746 RepID=UPI001D005ACC|nr:hypothetical protein [Microbulbifer taiwanensis]
MQIAKEIQAWLEQQGKKEGVDISRLESATLEVDVDTGKVATSRKKIVLFNFECRSNIKTNSSTYKANVKDIQQ